MKAYEDLDPKPGNMATERLLCPMSRLQSTYQQLDDGDKLAAWERTPASLRAVLFFADQMAEKEAVISAG